MKRLRQFKQVYAAKPKEPGFPCLYRRLKYYNNDESIKTLNDFNSRYVVFFINGRAMSYRSFRQYLSTVNSKQ